MEFWTMYFINEHEIVLDQYDRLEPWAPYDHVIQLAMNFIKNCPIDEESGLPWYLVYSCFWIDPLRPTRWPDNPAGKFAWAVTTLLKYYPYSGDAQHIEIVRSMLDCLITQRTPDKFDWGKAPFASAEPGKGLYFGARADGAYVTEADKIAQAGRAFIDFYEMSGEEKYLQAGQDCANVLLKHLKYGDEYNSPVPFRVSVRDGKVIEAYSADMIQLIRLFAELDRLGFDGYQGAIEQVWRWIEKYPLRNNFWKGYFEDIRIDPTNENRDQLSPLETARYLLHNHELDADWRSHVPALIEWVRKIFGATPFFSAIPIREQKYCFVVMGSHTARFASLCANWYKISRDEIYYEMAVRALNWASYMANEDGAVTVGVDRPDYYNQCWFTDGYFDYVPHFIDVMASIPSLAPEDSDHMLESSTVIQKIEYGSKKICYRTFDTTGCQLLKLSFTPREVYCGTEKMAQSINTNSNGSWHFDPTSHLLTVRHKSAEVLISGLEVETTSSV
ncbi:MAG: hypothetical protein BGO78_09045 [Chloroflexi bacterium 44-23]|nr:MAG: hypothetical protein BGO78_09045 [Chloroflexi bacterium 44-23]